MPDPVVLATSDDVKFIEGVTKMTQSNWMSYFGNAIPSGVIEGFKPFVDNRTNRISDGTVIANGIVAKITTDDGYTDFTLPDPYYSRYDTFLCVRVYFSEERAELVQKFNLSSSNDNDELSEVEENLITDESYGCIRNSEFYEVPVFYVPRTTNLTYWGRSLRRWGDKYYFDFTLPTSLTQELIRLSGANNIYFSSIQNHQVYAIDDMDFGDQCTLIVKNDLSASRELYLFRQRYTVGIKQYPSDYYYSFEFSDSSHWSTQTYTPASNITIDTYKTTVASGGVLRLRILKIGDKSFYIDEF